MLDFNPLTGEKVWFEDTQDGKFNITHEQNVMPVLENNKKRANSDDKTKKDMKRGMWRYASIPNVILMKWSQEIGSPDPVGILAPEHRKELFRRINLPEHQYLKTTRGRHSPKN